MEKKNLPTPQTGHSTEYGYRIEVRDTLFSTVRPIELHDGLVGPEWRECNPMSAVNPAGIPEDPPDWGHKSHHRLLRFDVALALAWTIIAQNHVRMGLECRIVKYKLETHYILERQGVVDERIDNQLIREVRRIKLLPEEGSVSVEPEAKGDSHS